MKAILVVEMPKDCWECPMHINGLDDENEEIMICNANAQESHYGEKPSWCPLRPLPEKMKHEDEIDYDYGYIDGRNECIDEITGETE